MGVTLIPIPQPRADKTFGCLKVAGTVVEYLGTLDPPHPHTVVVLVGGGWIIELIHGPGKSAATVCFGASGRSPSEELSPNGDIIGEYEVSIGFIAHGGSDLRKSGRRRWKPLGYGIQDIWRLEKWIEWSYLPPAVTSETTPTSSRVDLFTISWSIRKIADPLPKSVFYAGIVADLFDDKDASNVVFIISHPERGSEKEEYIYAHTKVLSASSEYFKTMFQSKFAEGTSALTTSTSTKPDLGLQELMHFMDSDYEDVPSKPTETSLATRSTAPVDFSRYRTVRITDTSYKTYYAMLYYLYTKTYSFAPLTSTSRHRKTTSRPNYSIVASTSSLSELAHVPISSAKSMYRLCHRLDITELKDAALEHIKKSLTLETIAAELSSPFTSRFVAIQTIEQDYFVKNWDGLKNTNGFGTFLSGLFDDQPEGADQVWLAAFRRIRAK